MKNLKPRFSALVLLNYFPARAGLGPRPGWGPGRVGPIWAHMLFVKNVTFRVQTAPFLQNNDGFLEISEASLHPRPAQSQKTERQIHIF